MLCIFNSVRDLFKSCRFAPWLWRARLDDVASAIWFCFVLCTTSYPRGNVQVNSEVECFAWLIVFLLFLTRFKILLIRQFPLLFANLLWVSWLCSWVVSFFVSYLWDFGVYTACFILKMNHMLFAILVLKVLFLSLLHLTFCVKSWNTFFFP